MEDKIYKNAMELITGIVGLSHEELAVIEKLDCGAAIELSGIVSDLGEDEARSVIRNKLKAYAGTVAHLMIGEVIRGDSTVNRLRTMSVAIRLRSLHVVSGNRKSFSAADLIELGRQLQTIVTDKAQLERPIDLSDFDSDEVLDNYTADEILRSFKPLVANNQYVTSAAFCWQPMLECKDVRIERTTTGAWLHINDHKFGMEVCLLTGAPLFVLEAVELSEYLSQLTGKMIRIIPLNMDTYCALGYIAYNYKRVMIKGVLQYETVTSKNNVYSGPYSVVRAGPFRNAVARQINEWAKTYDYGASIIAGTRSLDHTAMLLSQAVADELIAIPPLNREHLAKAWTSKTKQFDDAYRGFDSFTAWGKHLNENRGKMSIPVTPASVNSSLDRRRTEHDNHYTNGDYKLHQHNVTGNADAYCPDAMSTRAKFVPCYEWFSKHVGKVITSTDKLIVAGIATGHFLRSIKHRYPAATLHLIDQRPSKRAGHVVHKCDVTVDGYPDGDYLFDDIYPDGPDPSSVLAVKVAKLMERGYKAGFVKLGLCPNDVSKPDSLPYGLEFMMARYEHTAFISAGRMHNSEYYFCFAGRRELELGKRVMNVKFGMAYARFMASKIIAMNYGNAWKQFTFDQGYFAPSDIVEGRPMLDLALTTLRWDSDFDDSGRFTELFGGSSKYGVYNNLEHDDSYPLEDEDEDGGDYGLVDEDDYSETSADSSEYGSPEPLKGENDDSTRSPRADNNTTRSVNCDRQVFDNL